MSVPNIGPELSDPNASNGPDYARRGNPALVYRDEPLTDDVQAAFTRASAVSHRFGGGRYALSRPAKPENRDGGESDPQD